VSSAKDKHLLLLVDGHALIYRAYHAFPELTDPSGRLVNAVYGFARLLLKAIQEFEPTHVAVAFDHPSPTKRHSEYTEYKAHRAEMPDDLKPQIGIIKELVDALNIPRFELAGYEADDIVGTIASRECSEQQSATPDAVTAKSTQPIDVVIMTGDKDLLQLVNDCISVFIPGRGAFSHDVVYDAKQVAVKMGVRPDQVVDLKALMGDPSDNIPGVKGIGKKTAEALIRTLGSVDGVYAGLAALENGTATAEMRAVLKGAVITKLASDKENALLSKSLATIDRDVPLQFQLAACVVRDYDKAGVTKLFAELNFQSLFPLLPPDDFESGIQSALF
jgi:DNA polymerase-1